MGGTTAMLFLAFLSSSFSIFTSGVFTSLAGGWFRSLRGFHSSIPHAIMFYLLLFSTEE